MKTAAKYVDFVHKSKIQHSRSGPSGALNSNCLAPSLSEDGENENKDQRRIDTMKSLLRFPQCKIDRFWERTVGFTSEFTS